MRTFLAFLTVTFLLASCSQAQKPKKEETSEVLKDLSIVKSVLKPLSKRNVEVKSVEEEKNVKVPGFLTFKVTLIDKNRNIEVNKYIWVSKDGEYLALNMFRVEKSGEKVTIKPINPKEKIKKLPPKKVDLSWIKAIDRKLQEKGIPNVIGKGDKKVYVVWDVYCPFCYEHIKTLNGKELAEKGIELHLIPFPIHGKASIEGTAYFLHLSKEKGLEGAMKHISNLGSGKFRDYVKEFEKESKNYLSNLSKAEREKEERFAQELKNALVKHNVRGTPTIIYIPQGEKNNKGYMFLGYKPLDEVVKLK